MFQYALYPVPASEFDANTPTIVTLPDTDTDYVVMMQVSSRDDPLPPVNLTIESDGQHIAYEPDNGWQTVMGHSYRAIARFSPPESLECTINATAVDSADFSVFHHPEDIFRIQFHRVLPWWIVAAVLTVSGIAVLFFTLCRIAFQKEEIGLGL